MMSLMAKNFRRVTAALIVVMIAVGVYTKVDFTMTEAAGASMDELGAQTVALTNLQIDFGSGTAKTVQAYSLKGINFVRVRDITDNLGMSVAATTAEVGVKIDPSTKPASTAALPKLTQASASVTIVSGNCYYDGNSYPSECFKIGTDYFFKLTDICDSSKNAVAVNLAQVKAGKTVANMIYPYITIQLGSAVNSYSVKRINSDLAAASATGTTAVIAAATPSPTPSPTPSGSMAELGSQTAALVDQVIDYGGQATRTIQVYKIKTFLFLRVQSITDACGFTVTNAAAPEVGLKIDPFTKPASATALAKLTQTNTTVTVVAGNIYWDGKVYKSECFKLGSEYFYKLDDLIGASQNALAIYRVALQNGTKPITGGYPNLTTTGPTATDTTVHLKYALTVPAVVTPSPTPLSMPGGSAQANQNPVPTEAQVQQILYSFQTKYPTGTPYDDGTSYYWNGGIFTGGSGCMGFAMMLSDAAFGYLPATRTTNFEGVKVGDILRINNDSHSVIVIARSGDTLTLAQANVVVNNAPGIVKWGDTMTITDLKKVGNYVLTRYPQN